jgi:hypothetical protein
MSSNTLIDAFQNTSVFKAANSTTQALMMQFAPWHYYRHNDAPARVVGVWSSEPEQPADSLVVVSIKNCMLNFETDIPHQAVERVDDIDGWNDDDRAAIASLEPGQQQISLQPAGFIVAAQIFETLLDEDGVELPSPLIGDQ